MAASIKPSPGRKSDKIMRDAIVLALHRTHEVDGEERKRIYTVAEKLVLKACDGDVPAIKEVIDRVDGKAVQPVAGSDEDPPIAIELVRKLVRASPTHTDR